jgi:hypothetical protein
VISTGVLHHTRDARRAFAAITRKVKPGGIVVVGLYNAYGRVPTFLRSKVIGVLGPNIDHVVRTSIRDPRKADIWIKDQYFNPHETWHSMDEVLDWFDENGVRYLNCRPSLLGSNGEAADGLFSAGSSGVGYGVASDETYTSDLARETNRVGLNFGVSGFGGVGSLLVLRRELDLAPKFVVYGFWEDHLNRNVRPCLESGTPFCIPRPSVTIGPSGPSIRLPEDPVNALTRAKLWFGDGKPPFVKDFLASAVRNWGFFAAKFDRARAPEGVSDKDKIEAQAYVLQQMKQTADSIHAPLIVVWIPVYFYPEINDLPARLAAVIKDAGILLVDMAPRFREMQREGAVIAIPGNGHMTPAAHQAVAAAVAKLLKEHKMLEEHASSSRSSGCGVDAEAARCDGGDAH